MSNCRPELSLSPRHANIKGNELADQLAMKTVEEASDVENLQAIPSFGDVAMASKVSGNKKWQERSETNVAVGACIHLDLIWEIHHSFVSAVG